MSIVIVAIAAAFAFLVLLFKFGIKKALAFDLVIDVIVTLILIGMFAGTFAGMAAATFAGCIFSLVLYTVKLLGGYQKLTWSGWRSVPPRWTLSRWLSTAPRFDAKGFRPSPWQRQG